jgi:CBS domain-containing protein
MKTCADVMTLNPICCIPTDTIERVAQMMKAQDVGSIPVVESPNSKKLVGIITDRDLVLKGVAEGRDCRDSSIAGIMTRNPVTCRERDDVEKALKAMSEHQVRRLPIVNDGNEIVGIIAQADIATRVAEPNKVAEVVEDISRA